VSTVEFKNVKKSYGQTEVVHGVNIEINRGDFVVIVGPSGCGKSTVLRMLAGLEEVSTGEIFINDECVNDFPPKKRDIAMVFQNYALYPHMTVYDNMAYGLKMHGFKRDEIKKRVTKAADILRLEKYLKRKPGNLSGGQRQRVAMGRAIVRQPALFLFDEPLSNLDAKLRVDMRLQIRKLQRDLGITSIYVTHDQVEAMTLADKLIVMNEGRVEQVGKPLDVYHNPASKFVAQFIGSPAMNFIPAKVNNHSSAVVLVDQQVLSLTAKLPMKYDGQAITVGIRPESLKIADRDDPDQFRITVDMVEALGCDTIVYGRMAGLHNELIVKLPGHIKSHVGEMMTLSVKEKDLYFFCEETGKRIVSLSDTVSLHNKKLENIE